MTRSTADTVGVTPPAASGNRRVRQLDRARAELVAAVGEVSALRAQSTAAAQRRDKALRSLRRQGLTYAELAALAGLSIGRVAQIAGADQPTARTGRPSK